MDQMATDERIKRAVRQTYGDIARPFVEEPVPSRGLSPSKGAVEESARVSCCAPSQTACCCGPSEVTVGNTNAATGLYSTEELAGLPDDVTDVSLGCGNPTAIAELEPGEVVLDLGSGGGIDCFLAARQVGPEGHVIGLDMTPEMIKLARRNAKKVGATNVEFRYGEMEDIPLPDGSVDAIISNCVVNLSPDKDAVFSEAYRVLRPGGRMTVSDIVVHGELPQPLRDSLDAWAGCLAGALPEPDYLARIRAVGFEEVEILSRDYVKIGETAGWEDAQALVIESGLLSRDLDHTVASIRVKAHKPA